MNFYINKIDKNLYEIKKEYFLDKATHGSDISGPYWMLMEVKIKSGKMWHVVNNEKIYPPGEHFYIFIPPFCWTMEFYEKNTDVVMRGLISKSCSGINFPKKPILFNSSMKFPRLTADINLFLNSAKNSKFIELCIEPTSLSNRAKKILDNEYFSGIELQAIAKRLKTSHSVLARSFKKDFGYPLSYYKKGLRITVGMYELMMGNPPTVAAQLAGYNDLGRFYKQFKQYLRQNPSEYSNKSKNAKT